MSGNSLPTVHDEEDLKQTIAALLEDGGVKLFKNFFKRELSATEFFQGDIVNLPAPLPQISADGQPAISECDITYWALVGNSCDITRPNVQFTNIVPVTVIPEQSLNADQKAAIQSYKAQRVFFYPPWATELQGHVCYVDFTQIVPLHKNALEVCTRVSTLQNLAAYLFHCCIIRYFARADGRYNT